MEKNNRKLIKGISIAIISILIIAIIGLGIYMLFIKNDSNDVDDSENNSSVNYSKIDETKDWIYVHKGNTYETNFGGSKQISLDYPIININTQSVRELNNLIKTRYENIENGYKEMDIYDGCTCIKINGSNRCSDHIETLQYTTEETMDYIQILLYSFINTECASGDSDLKSYIISTKTGKILDNKEIIDYFKYDYNKLLQKYNEYMKKEYAQNDEEYHNEDDINNLSLLIHNDKLIILTYPPVADGFMTLSFDGNNVESFYDYDDPINRWW